MPASCSMALNRLSTSGGQPIAAASSTIATAVANNIHQVYRTPGRSRDRALGRQRHRWPRQRLGRDDQTALQGLGDPPARPRRSFEAVEYATPNDRLVQPKAVPRAYRQHPARRSRSTAQRLTTFPSRRNSNQPSHGNHGQYILQIMSSFAGILSRSSQAGNSYSHLTVCALLIIGTYGSEW